MLKIFLMKYKIMILVSIFFFYLGCGITLSFLRLDCDAIATLNSRTDVDTIEYAVLILSSPDNENKRDAIRATWARFAGNIFVENGEKLYKWNHTWTGDNLRHNLIQIYFVLGTRDLEESKYLKLKMENARSEDLLLLESLEDTYKNLATKLLHAMKWFSNNLRNLKYLIKCDDDSFVRIDLVVRDLEAFAPEMNAPAITEYISNKNTLPSFKGLYWGYFDGRAHVYSNGKWQEKDWFLCDNYLPYALGGGYVVSRNIVDYIARNADILSHYNSEDVSMGVWTAALDGINRVHDTRFDTEWKSRGCSKNMLVRHKQSPSDMFDMYRMLVRSQGEKLCKNEALLRKSYVYKWNVPPSMCCR